MTEEDDVYFKSYNQKRPAATQISEDDFERFMEVFEDTAFMATPYAMVDKTVVPYDLMVPGLNELQAPKLMIHAKDLYEYWKSQRISKDGALHPTLKFETHQDSDDMDPYVCFRRREVRQTRKTRARDIQSADKLKKLRKELEDGRQLIIESFEREMLKRDCINTDRATFEQRAKLKDTKVRLGIKTDDEDLIHQKVSTREQDWGTQLLLTTSQPQKRKAPELPVAQRPIPTQLRLPVRPDGRSADADLVQLRDTLAEKDNEMRIELETKIENHRRWNLNHVDLTSDPLPPVRGKTAELSFRPAKTQYLMTPPASASGDEDEATAMDIDKEEAPAPMMHFIGVSSDATSQSPPTMYRRRIGRLNRLWIDRRGMGKTRPAVDGSDRWKYDMDSDSEDDEPIYERDQFDLRALKFRASIPLSATRRPDSAMPNGVHGVGPQGRLALPPSAAQAQSQQPKAPAAAS